MWRLPNKPIVTACPTVQPVQLTYRVPHHFKRWQAAGCTIPCWRHQQQLAGAHALMTRFEEASAGAALGLAGPFMGRACSAGAFPAA